MPNLVYVLVSEPQDYFAEMAVVSMWAARRVMPGVTITVLMDGATESALSGVRAKVRDMADRLVVASTGDAEDAMSRSRWIKTTMRSYVDGDFLFLDVDAVPVTDLSDICTYRTPVAAALDGNVPSDAFVFQEYERACFERTRWPFPIRPYFNSGVLWVRDHPMADRLFTLWHELWQESRRVGPPKDQPALNYANLQLGQVIGELPPQYNVLTALYRNVIRGSRVLHYTTIRFEQRDDVHFIRIVKGLRSTGRVDEQYMMRVLATNYPWTDELSFRNHILVGGYWRLPMVAARRVARALVG